VRHLAAAYLLLMLITSCGSTASSSISTASRLQHALALWQRFPAGNQPRPILRLVGTNPDLPGAFTSQDAETAFYCDKFTRGSEGFSPDMPAESHVTWKFGTTLSYPAISAQAAFGELSSRRERGSSSQSCQKVPPLVLTSARLGTAEFFTDRGPSEMSAYMFTMMDASGQLAYPAVAPSAFWASARGMVSGGGVADVSDDGMSMIWGFAGAPPGQGALPYRLQGSGRGVGHRDRSRYGRDPRTAF
jgi:hypothetical protein